MVDGTATDSVTIGKLSLGMVLWNVHDEVELVVGNHFHDVRHVLVILVGPSHGNSLHMIVVEELGCSLAGINGVAVLYQSLGGIEHGSLLLGATARNHDALLL